MIQFTVHGSKQRLLKRILLINAVIILILSGITAAHSLPYTKSPRSIPDESLYISLTQKTVYSDKNTTATHINTAVPFYRNIEFGFNTSYIEKTGSKGYSGLGDSSFYFSYLAASLFSDSVLFSGFVSLMIPAVEKYSRPEYSDTFQGVHQFETGIAARKNSGSSAFHASAFWIFREDRDEDFFSKSFFDRIRFKNDGYAATIAWNNKRFYPFVPFFDAKGEFLLPFRNKSLDEKNFTYVFQSVKVCSGLRFFFNEYLSLSGSFECAVYQKKRTGYRAFSGGFDILF